MNPSAKIVNEFVVMTMRGTVIAECPTLAAAERERDNWNTGGEGTPRGSDERRAAVLRWVSGRLTAVTA